MKKLLLALVFFAITAHAHNELVLSQSLTAITGSGFGSSVYGGFHAEIEDRFQLGGTIGVVGTKVSGTAFALDLSTLFGATVNFALDDKYEFLNSFFLFGGIGPHIRSPDTVHLQFGFELGKRFELASNVTYRPTVGILCEGSQENVFSITPISLSILF